MSKLIVKISDFSVSNLTAGQLKPLESGGKMANLSYNNNGSNGPLITQVGPLTLPYGMNVFDKNGPAKYSMDLSLRGYDSDESVTAMYEAFNALDEWMIDQGVLNSKAWFKAPLDRSVVKAFYTPMVKVAKDADGNPKPYPPTIKINLRKDRTNADAWEVKVYERVDGDVQKVEGVPLEDLLIKGAQVTTLIQCTSIWFAGSKFGLSWKANQIRMEKVPDTIRGYAMLDEGASASQGAATQAPRPSTTRPAPTPTPAPAPVPATRPAAAAATSKNKFSNLDEEEVEDDDVFAPPAPVPTPTPVQPVAKKQSVLTAMMPSLQAPAPVPVPADDDDDAGDFEPVPAPKKTTTTVKKVAKLVKKNN